MKAYSSKWHYYRTSTILLKRSITNKSSKWRFTSTKRINFYPRNNLLHKVVTRIDRHSTWTTRSSNTIWTNNIYGDQIKFYSSNTNKIKSVRSNVYQLDHCICIRGSNGYLEIFYLDNNLNRNFSCADKICLINNTWVSYFQVWCNGN